LVTLIRGTPNIDKSKGIKRLAAQGLELLSQHDNTLPFSDEEKFKLLSIGNDLHRKVVKAEKRGQAASPLVADTEAIYYQHVRNHSWEATASDHRAYFTLFAESAQLASERQQEAKDALPVEQALQDQIVLKLD
jgi:hypothetical protein